MVAEGCESWTTDVAFCTVKRNLRPFAPNVAGIQSIRMLPIITGLGGYLLGELSTMHSTSAI